MSMSSPRRLASHSRGNSSSSRGGVGMPSAFPMKALSSALLLASMSHTSPALAFLLSPRAPMSPTCRSLSPGSAVKRAETVGPLYGIKRKVKVEMEENFTGKVVEPAGAQTSMFGSDANALFDLIEKNKKKAAEASAAMAADGDGESDGEREDADGEDAADKGESG